MNSSIRNRLILGEPVRVSLARDLVEKASGETLFFMGHTGTVRLLTRHGSHDQEDDSEKLTFIPDDDGNGTGFRPAVERADLHFAYSQPPRPHPARRMVGTALALCLVLFMSACQMQYDDNRGYSEMGLPKRPENHPIPESWDCWPYFLWPPWARPQS